MAVDIVVAKLIFNQQVVKRPKNQIYEIIFSNDCLSVFARKRQSKMFLRRRQEKQRSLVNGRLPAVSKKATISMTERLHAVTHFLNSVRS